MNTIPLKLKVLITALFLVFFITVIILFFLRAQRVPDPPTDILPTPTTLPNLSAYPRPTILQAVDLEYTESYPISFALDETPELPSDVDIVSINHSLSSEKLSFLTNSFSFNSEPTIIDQSVLWIKSEGHETLLVNRSSGFIQYVNTPRGLSVNRERAFYQQVVGVSNSLVSGLNIPNIAHSPAIIKGYEDDHVEAEEEVTDLESAYMYKIYYPQNFRGIPVYYQFGTPGHVTVWIDMFGDVRKVEYFNLQITSMGKVNIKTLEQVVREAQRGEGITVKVGDIDRPIDNIVSAEINDISLGYFDDKTGSILYPVYILKGTAQLTGSTEEIVIYIPAT